VSLRYTSIYLPGIDAKVAAAVSVGGPAKYVIKDGSGVSEQWLISEYVPQISRKFGNRVALVLGKALLWASNDDQARNMIPVSLQNRLTARYLQVQQLEDGTNPIEKVELVVYNVEGQVKIEPVMPVDGSNNISVAGGADQPSMQVLLAQNNALQLRMMELANMQRTQHEVVQQQFQRLNRVVARFANRPAQAVGGFFAPRQAVPVVATMGGDDDSDDNSVANNNAIVRNEATLSTCAKTLFVLWEEYEYGLQGRKPAKKFNSRERGRVKHKYHRRKVMWDLISHLIRKGYSYHSAIDLIHRTYGDLTVTEIINKVKADNKTGGHPDLL
jgi:Transcriptional activator of glycolytic enzymes